MKIFYFCYVLLGVIHKVRTCVGTVFLPTSPRSIRVFPYKKFQTFIPSPSPLSECVLNEWSLTYSYFVTTLSECSHLERFSYTSTFFLSFNMPVTLVVTNDNITILQGKQMFHLKNALKIKCFHNFYVNKHKVYVQFVYLCNSVMLIII